MHDICLRVMNHDSQEPSPHCWLLLDFSPAAEKPIVNVYLSIVFFFLLQLLHFLRINSQEGENRVKGHADFCGLCYIMQRCLPKETMSVSGSKTQSVNSW